jgi:DNA polymerase-3 subunit epsilon
MDPAAEAVHGFSLEKLYELSNGQYFEDLLEKFITDFEEADFVIGHNVNFDVKFLKSELQDMCIDYEPKHTFCTMQYYKDICRIPRANGENKNPKLEEVVNFLNITKQQILKKCEQLFEGSGNYHDARFDTTATYLLIIEGIKKGYIPAGYFSSRL